MSYCRLCRQKTPCACTPYNAIRERGEPGPQGVNAPIPEFVATVTEGAVNVIITGTLLEVDIEYFQPTPDTDLDYVWLGTNTFTGGFITEGSLDVEVGDGVDTGLYLPGSTVTTSLIVTGTTTMNGNILFDMVQYAVTTIDSEGFAYFLGATTIPNLTITGNLTISGTGTLPGFVLNNVDPYTREFIAGSTNIVLQSLIEDCYFLRTANAGMISEPLQIAALGVDLEFLPADTDEHEMFMIPFIIGEPDCGSGQTATADILAFVEVGSWNSFDSSRWTIRMRAGGYDGTILDEFTFSPYTGHDVAFPNMQIPMRYPNVSIATGTNGIYFTAQSVYAANSNLSVFPNTSKLIVK